MAVVITPFQHQNIPINTPFSLRVRITGNPSRVLVEGPVLGFSYSWESPYVRIYGSADRYLKDFDVKITADDETFTGKFSIVPVAPIIAPLSRVIVNRGVPIVIPVPITGRVTSLDFRGPYIGLKDRLVDSGAEVYGTIPASSDASLTIRTFEFQLTAYHDEAFDTETLEIELAVGS
ncbi:MAG: hypothetical protein OXL96_28195 [Candidatus Poribacteria bacterium]|nr:hypothetical protein [Candidatus Poribacteria bacterium]